jgi:hypothetical protein
VTTRETIAWVPVGVEKPDDGAQVLACVESAAGNEVTMAFFWTRNGGEWQDVTEDCQPVHGNVTHWAAMPTGARP